MLVRFILIVTATQLVSAGLGGRQRYDVELGRSRSRISTRSFKWPRLQAAEDVFNVLDVTFLAHVWPKLRNGVHVALEPRCWEHVAVLSKDLLDAKLWAYSAVDATGRYESGLLEGNRYWLGSRQQCQRLDTQFLNKNQSRSSMDLEHMESFVNAAYLRENYYDATSEGEWFGLAYHDLAGGGAPGVDARSGAPFRMAYFTAKFGLNVTKPKLQSQIITLGLCLPQSCSAADVQAILDFSIMINDNLKSNRTLPRTAKVTEVRLIHDSYDLISDPMALLLIILTTLLLLLTIVGTCADLGIVKFKPRNCKSMSFDLQQPNANIEFKSHDRTLKDYSNNKLEPIHKSYERGLHNKVVDMETLTINNINNANINMVTVKKVVKPDARPPSITLDVVAVDEETDSCQRCGKYRKQCPNQRKFENLPACPRMRNHSFTSFAAEVEDEEKNYFCKSILVCFSLKRSWKKLTNTNLASKDLAVVHLFKITATLWIIYTQVALVLSHISDNTGDINDRSMLYNILATGTLAFDMLIFVSGVLSAHHFFYLKSRYTVEELVSFGGSFGHVLQFVCFVTNRAVRLLPSYMYAIILTSVTSRAFHMTSPLELPERDHVTCDVTWWRNLLYINSFYNVEDRCMQISWYLSVESQLHALVTLLLATGRARLALLLGACLALAALAADTVTYYWDFADRFTDVFSMYEFVVDRPWARAAPYLAGVLTGWLVHRAQGSWDVSKTKLTTLWVVSVAATCAAAAAPWARAGRAADSAVAGARHALAPALLAVAAISAANCPGWVRRGLEWRPLAALSRLSYGCLLLHAPLARLVLLTHAHHLGHAELWCYVSGVCGLSLCASLALSLLLETPSAALLRAMSDCAAC